MLRLKNKIKMGQRKMKIIEWIYLGPIRLFNY